MDIAASAQEKMIEKLLCAVIIAILMLSGFGVYDAVITSARQIERMINQMRCYECGAEMDIVMWHGIMYYQCPECESWEDYDG